MATTKKKGDEKVIAVVRKIVAGALAEADAIEKRGKEAWKATESRRKKIVTATKGALGRADRIKDGIMEGFRIGMKDAEKGRKARK